MILRLTCLTGSLVGAIAFPGFSVLAAERPTYTIHRTDAPITIDGRLDEPDWRAAPSVGAFQFPWWMFQTSVASFPPSTYSAP